MPLLDDKKIPRRNELLSDFYYQLHGFLADIFVSREDGINEAAPRYK